ncbi:MAG: hypothetical protein OQK55_00230 [Thermoanaerobaculales bacterium]|nr:hypothetical protein [Thermoanaerobaculales bacterium]
MKICTDAWEALRGDPLPWLLDQQQPNLHWRVLVELVRRPPESPAVVRARGGSDAVHPVASLISDLLPNGTWATDQPLWRPYSGPGWRLLAAIQWGANPADPRLQSAAEALLETAPGEGGFAQREGGRPVPWLTARALHGLAELGWCRHPRFQEGLAWLEDGEAKQRDGGWQVVGRQSVTGECEVTVVALLGALTACVDRPRQVLRGRAVESLGRITGAAGAVPARFGHPCLGRTDEAELLWALARAGAPLRPGMVGALKRVQRRQLNGGRWRRDVPVPVSLPVPIEGAPGEPSRWVTLKCVVALMHYAVEAQLPRMYPQKPK